MEFTTTIVRKFFDDICTCSQTKWRVIIYNFIAPFAKKKKKKILLELKESCFILCMIDSPNHMEEKLVPLIFRYFQLEKVVMVKELELVNLVGETSSLLLSYVLEVLQKLDVIEKIIAYQQIIPVRTLAVRRGRGRIICITNCKQKHQTT
jgi:hypothetical protein